MNKVTFLLGPQGSGKTHQARLRSKDKRAKWMVANNRYYSFSIDGAASDIAIIEDALSYKDVKRVVESAIVRVSYPPFEVARPELIITSQVLGREDIPVLPHFEVIECNYKNNE